MNKIEDPYLKKYYEEVKSHFNEPVIIGSEVCRIIGFGVDDEDYYLIVNSRSRGKFWMTFVGGYIYLDCLKGQHAIASKHTDEIWDDYFRMNSFLTLNGVPEEKEFVFINIITEGAGVGSPDSLENCGDLVIGQ